MESEMPIEDAMQPDAESIRSRNDKLILSALETLRDPTKRAKLKLKCTVPALCKLTNLSTNTIRSRDWARNALEKLKTESKVSASGDKVVSDAKGVPAVNLLDALRKRVTVLLEQNTFLFDEILVLREQVKARELIIQELQGSRLSVVRPPQI
jgi:hypothetical protein